MNMQRTARADIRAPTMTSDIQFPFRAHARASPPRWALTAAEALAIGEQRMPRDWNSLQKKNLPAGVPICD
jgi:hypothetical protein